MCPRGCVNIIEHARKVTGEKEVYGILGGTHLGLASEEQRRSIEYLKNLNLKFLAPNHCTGLAIISELRAMYGDKMHFASVGAEFEFE